MTRTFIDVSILGLAAGYRVAGEVLALRRLVGMTRSNMRMPAMMKGPMAFEDVTLFGFLMAQTLARAR